MARVSTSQNRQQDRPATRCLNWLRSGRVLFQVERPVTPSKFEIGFVWGERCFKGGEAQTPSKFEIGFVWGRPVFQEKRAVMPSKFEIGFVSGMRDRPFSPRKYQARTLVTSMASSGRIARCLSNEVAQGNSTCGRSEESAIPLLHIIVSA